MYTLFLRKLKSDKVKENPVEQSYTTVYKYYIIFLSEGEKATTKTISKWERLLFLLIFSVSDKIALINLETCLGD